MATKRPKSVSSAQLKKVGVEIVDPDRLHLKCKTCGQLWSPDQPKDGGRLPSGYWKCPNGCNDTE